MALGPLATECPSKLLLPGREFSLPRLRLIRTGRTSSALKYRDGGFAVFEHLVSQLPRSRDDAARCKRAAAIPFLGGARGYHLLVGAPGGVVRANRAGTPLRSG